MSILTTAASSSSPDPVASTARRLPVSGLAAGVRQVVVRRVRGGSVAVPGRQSGVTGPPSSRLHAMLT